MNRSFKAHVVGRYPKAKCTREPLTDEHRNLRLGDLGGGDGALIWAVRDEETGKILGVTDHVYNGAATAWRHAYSRMRTGVSD